MLLATHPGPDGIVSRRYLRILVAKHCQQVGPLRAATCTKGSSHRVSAEMPVTICGSCFSTLKGERFMGSEEKPEYVF